MLNLAGDEYLISIILSIIKTDKSETHSIKINFIVKSDALKTERIVRRHDRCRLSHIVEGIIGYAIRAYTSAFNCNKIMSVEYCYRSAYDRALEARKMTAR